MSLKLYQFFTCVISTNFLLSYFQFLQVCIIQRSMFTASDAIYCAKFVELCHKMQASNFSTLIYFDRIFSDVSHIVTNCTDNEASRYEFSVSGLVFSVLGLKLLDLRRGLCFRILA